MDSVGSLAGVSRLEWEVGEKAGRGGWRVEVCDGNRAGGMGLNASTGAASLFLRQTRVRASSVCFGESESTFREDNSQSAVIRVLMFVAKTSAARIFRLAMMERPVEASAC
jgi:hypothetical protein